MTEKTVRTTLHLTKDIIERSERLMPWGMRSQIIRAILDKALDVAEEHGTLAFGAILDGQYEITLKKEKKNVMTAIL